MFSLVALKCTTILCMSLCAGGIFLFPLLAPGLIEHLHLTQPQLSTIALAGMAGQYPFSFVVGWLFDRYGPQLCSFLAAVMFSAAFGLSASELSSTPGHSERPGAAVAWRLTIYFAMAGLGTVLSYFAFVFSATKTFTRYLTIASGVTMALFGLSPLFLSYIASKFFSDSSTGVLNISQFLQFLAMSTGVVNLAGAFTLVIPSSATTSSTSNSSATNNDANEQSPLINRETAPDCMQDPRDNSTLEFLRDPYFWILAFYMVMILGACEMIISNVGTIVISLPSQFIQTLTSEGEQVASLQVKILSVSNTLSRLLVGPVADFVSPVFSYQHPEGFTTVTKHRMSRMVFLSGSASLLAITCAWMVFGVQTRHDVWLLSVGTGITYGAVWTVLPGVTCSVWGIRNLARNFGLIAYSPFVGTPIFSYVYALIVARHTLQGMTCKGRICWESTFIFSLGTSLAALAITAILWRKWSGRM
ncbi:major facilitator superfamily domain-containing protein [Rhodocollybia butyracea]|uniref:Major facilitator superfamily domain-containing protein n=1 Tax=Rhodocollybia butyracea TaxID=206335 RepID=A0A9P5PWM0_9AGAR|nr:major facilitator superfamily domain-containing protein [Rhodocollybia butyracea]